MVVDADIDKKAAVNATLCIKPKAWIFLIIAISLFIIKKYLKPLHGKSSSKYFNNNQGSIVKTVAIILSYLCMILIQINSNSQSHFLYLKFDFIIYFG